MSATPINQVVEVVSNILRSSRTVQSTNAVAVLYKAARATDEPRFDVVEKSSYTTNDTVLAQADVKLFLDSLFGQDNSPPQCTLIIWNTTGGTETCLQAINDALSQGANFYFTCYDKFRDDSDYSGITADQEELIEACKQSDERLFPVVQSNDPEIPDSAVSTDICSISKSKSLEGLVICHADSYIKNGTSIDVKDERVDGAILGVMSTRVQGKNAWSYQKMRSVTGGLFEPTQKTAILAKSGNYAQVVEKSSDVTLHKARVSSGEDCRIIWGRDYFDIKTQADIYQYFVQEDAFFDSQTQGAVYGILQANIDILINRRIVFGYDTANKPVIAIPDFDSLPTIEQQEGDLRLIDCYQLSYISKILKARITGSFQLPIN